VPNRKLPIVAAAAFLALAGTVTFAPAASAHDTSRDVYGCRYQGQFRCGYGGVTNSHTRVYSCDTAGDGYGFRTEYRLRSGSGFVDDANGSSSGCSSVTPGSSANPVTQFRACQKQNAWWCSEWAPA